MAMIFPGMDPYLEDPHLWPGLHNRLIVYLADRLQLALGSRYIASIEERVFVEGPHREIVPDVLVKRGRPEDRGGGGGGVAVLEADAPILVRVPEREVHETYVAILDRQAGLGVVTVIEVVSPSNKFAGPGRISYESKQREVLASPTHLVEIDLLRAGPHVLAIPEWAARREGDYTYLVSVNRASGLRDEFELYPRGLRDRLPRVRIPLTGADPDVALDLQAVLAQAYEAGRYGDVLAYESACVPSLSPEDQAWAASLIRGHAAG